MVRRKHEYKGGGIKPERSNTVGKGAARNEPRQAGRANPPPCQTTCDADSGTIPERWYGKRRTTGSTQGRAI